MKHNQRDLLLSIHFEYAIKIVNGLKTIELRRKFPLFKEEDEKKIFVYACSPISQIIGECELKEVKKFSLKRLWNETKDSAMIDQYSFKKYFKNCIFGFALYLNNPVKYDQFIGLKQIFGQNNSPPQSYRYMAKSVIVTA